MSKMPAITTHAHYLFEDGVLEFDQEVEIHCTRFGGNQQAISTDSVPNYPFPVVSLPLIVPGSPGPAL